MFGCLPKVIEKVLEITKNTENSNMIFLRSHSYCYVTSPTKKTIWLKKSV